MADLQRAQLQSQGAEGQAATNPLPGVSYKGKVVGTWDKVWDAAIKAGDRSGPGFREKETAIAYAKSLSGSVIIRHQDWFVVHEVDISSVFDFERDNIKQMSGSKHVWTNITREGCEVDGVAAFVTEDGWPVEAKLARRGQPSTRYHQRTDKVPGNFNLHEFTEQPDKLPDNVLDPYKKGALEATETDEEYLRGFYNAMRDFALDTLTKSESEVRSQRPKFNGQEPPDRETMNSVAQLLIDKDKQIEAAERRLKAVRFPRNRQQTYQQRKASFEAKRKPIQEDIEMRRMERQIILGRYPTLAMVDLDDFVEMSPHEQAQTIHGEMGDVMENIETTRENILNTELSLWDTPNIVQATMAGLGVDPAGQKGQLILDKVQSEKTNELIANIAIAVFQIGLAIGAAIATGGLALVLGGAGLAVGAADAAYQTDRYFTHTAAAATAIDPTGSIINPDELGMEGFWVVVSWVGVGIDVGAAVKAVKALKSGKAMSEVLEEGASSGLTQDMVESAAEQVGNIKHAEDAVNAAETVGRHGDEAADAAKGAMSADEAVKISDEIADAGLDRVSEGLRSKAGLDANKIEEWISEFGVARASEMMGDELLKVVGLDVNDALRMMKENPTAFYEEYGALLSGAVLRRSMTEDISKAATEGIVKSIPDAKGVKFADSDGFAITTEFDAGSGSAKASFEADDALDLTSGSGWGQTNNVMPGRSNIDLGVNNPTVTELDDFSKATGDLLPGGRANASEFPNSSYHNPLAEDGSLNLTKQTEKQASSLAEEMGFSTITHYAPGESANKILSSGEMMPGSNSGGLVWATTRFTRDKATKAQSFSFADYGRNATEAIPIVLPKDILIPPSKALETKNLPEWLNKKAYAVKGLLQSSLGRAAKAPPVAMEGPIHLFPKGMSLTSEELMALQGRIAGTINTKGGETKKKVVLLALGTANGAIVYYYHYDQE